MKKWSLFLFISLCSAALTPNGQAKVDPEIDWVVLDSTESRWIFDKREEELARECIAEYLRVREALSAVFSERPEQTTFVLSDNTDLANGSATAWPYPLISLNPVLPSQLTALGEFGNPIYEIILHEYTHILNLYPAHGIIKIPRWIFGNIISPNMLLPRWYIEGLAVYMESYFGDGGGRLHSQYIAGLARAFTLKKKWGDYSIDQLNDSPPDWLGGNRAYLLGGIFWEKLAAERGVEVIEKLNQSHSRRIPYFINGAIENETGANYADWLERSYHSLIAKTEAQIRQISAVKPAKSSRIRQRQAVNRSPKISPDGNYLAYISHSDRGGSELVVVKRARRGFYKSKNRILTKARRAQKISWSRDSLSLFFDAVSIYKKYSLFSDIYRYDLKSKEKKQITFGLRANSPTLSPDGDWIYFIQNYELGQRVAKVDLNGKNFSVVKSPEKFTHILDLTFIDADHLALSLHPKGQERRLFSFNLKDQELKLLIPHWNASVNFLQMTKKGLLFSSAKSGIENLYLLSNPLFFLKGGSITSEAEQPKPITHTKTRATSGDFDKEKGSLIFTQMTERGERIYQSRSTHWRFLPATLPRVTPLYKDLAQKRSLAEERDSPPNKATKPESLQPNQTRPYSSLSYLVPRYWTPYLYFIPEGTVFQAITSASDPLQKQAYTLIAQADTLTQKPGFIFNYLNNSTDLEFALSAADLYNYFYPHQTNLHNQALTLSANYTLSDDLKWNSSLFFDYKNTDGESSSPIERQGPGIALSYQNVTKKRGDITPTSGGLFQLSHVEYLEDISTTPYGGTNFHSQLYTDFLLPKGHALALIVNGSYAPELKEAAIASSTISARLNSIDQMEPLLRGYPSGVFLGKNMLSLNGEYRFPLASLFRGYGTLPLFLKSVHARLFFDTTSLDGLALESSEGATQSVFVSKTFGSEWFSSYGIELVTDWTAGYYLPISLVFGLHQGMNRESGGDLRYFLGFVL
ncbi:hypothetical protein OAQ84_00770 [Bdellovibrionales bacterium]|nr:hypothetical protein [Bdellovibrionales bacterium]